jgi:glucose-1-phosphate adenylyltransferase
MAVMAMILAGGEGPALSVLTAKRSEAAVPFAGKYRIIDFALSNCVNSGIFDVAVLTQYQPRSLNEHIGVGRPWDLDRTTGGVRLLQPYQSTKGERGAWQEGTADALRFNLNVVRPSVDEVLILAGNHIYTMDYGPLLRAHRERNADVTLAVYTVPAFEAYRFGMVTTDTEGRVQGFQEKPRRTRSTLASMGIYVFNRQVLVDWLTPRNGNGDEGHVLARDLIPRHLATSRIYTHHFQGYWANVGTIQAYYEANMGLLTETPPLDLYNPDWVIHTRSEERAAALIGPDARVEGNLLCDGCRVDGTVMRSIISPGVYVAPGAVVRDSIIMNDTVVAPGAEIDRAIVDKRVVVQEGARLGWGDRNTPNRDHPDRLNTGLTLVGKDALIPQNVRVGRNVVVYPRAAARSYPEEEVLSGATVNA